MKRITTSLALALFLSSCGTDSPPPIATDPAQTVELAVDSNGCLIDSNADHKIEYLMGDKQAINHVWRYLNTNESYTLLAIFDYTEQCYREDVGVFGATEISLSKIPDVPLYEISPETFTGSLTYVGSNTYAFGGTICATNSGNVAAFGVSWSVSIDDVVTLGTGTYDPMINESFSLSCGFRSAVLLNGIVSGQAYTFALIHRNIYGDVISSQTLMLTAN